MFRSFLFSLLFFPMIFLGLLYFLFFTSIGQVIVKKPIEFGFSTYTGVNVSVQKFEHKLGDLFFNITPELPVRYIEVNIQYSLKCISIYYYEEGNYFNYKSFLEKTMLNNVDATIINNVKKIDIPIYFEKSFCI